MTSHPSDNFWRGVLVFTAVLVVAIPIGIIHLLSQHHYIAGVIAGAFFIMYLAFFLDVQRDRIRNSKTHRQEQQEIIDDEQQRMAAILIRKQQQQQQAEQQQQLEQERQLTARQLVPTEQQDLRDIFRRRRS